MIHEARARQRIVRAANSLQDYWKFCYARRRINLGDRDALVFGSGIGSNYDIGWSYHRRFRDSYPGILMQHVDEGLSNDIYNSLAALVDQSIMQNPNVEINHLSAHMREVGKQYLDRRLKQCHAVEHNKVALWDYFLGGLGPVYIGDDQTRPTVRWVDTLDFLFEQTAQLPCDITWAAHTVCKPLDYWRQMFGKQDFEKYVSRGRDGKFTKEAVALDLPFEVVFYFDLEPTIDWSGDKPKITEADGSYLIFIRTSETDVDEEPVYKGRNPNWEELHSKDFPDLDGQRVPFLPYETMIYSMVPGQRLPMSAFDKALPAQIAVWDAITRGQATRDGAPAFLEVEKGVMGQTTMEKFKESLLNGIVQVEHLGGIKEHTPGNIAPFDAEEIGRNRASIKEQLGISANVMGNANLSAHGGRLSPTENKLIAQLGSLSSSAAGKANADLWSRFVPKFVARGKLYDQAPFIGRFEGEPDPATGEVKMIEMPFGQGTQNGPVADYLRPDAEYIITEDQLKRVPPDVRIQKAQAGLAMALNPVMLQLYPSGVEPAYREFLYAIGADDVEARIRRAQQGGPGAMAQQAAQAMQPASGTPG